ncbi:MAG: LacI family DNA-binding transcriptional regulator [Ardenticatenia bacterium]|nr:LacI family DNA-binding transcriptional regulator [Ardenticatenia bacterium]
MTAKRRVTIRDVAEQAGVSQTTVSFVLNNVEGMRISAETRQRVLETARALGYHPDASARRLVQGRTRVVAFIEYHSPHAALVDPFLAEVLRGLHAVARQRGYHILFEPLTPSDEAFREAFVRLVRERHADGVILSGPRFDDRSLLPIRHEEVPVVLHGRPPSGEWPFIDVDNVHGAHLATEHLIRLGHRRIALITHAPLVYTAAADRRAGYIQALQAAGLPVEPTYIREAAFTPESGKQAMYALLTVSPRPTAVFVAGDTVALGVLQAAKEAGLRVPDDVAVVGFDDIPLAAYFAPPLTTVRLPAYGLGWGAGDLLIRLLEEEEVRSPHVLLQTELVVRRSCGAASPQTP